MTSPECGASCGSMNAADQITDNTAAPQFERVCWYFPTFADATREGCFGLLFGAAKIRLNGWNALD
jgi:hypothetical protein